jgi:hypothetical protein
VAPFWGWHDHAETHGVVQRTLRAVVKLVGDRLPDVCKLYAPSETDRRPRDVVLAEMRQRREEFARAAMVLFTPYRSGDDVKPSDVGWWDALLAGGLARITKEGRRILVNMQGYYSALSQMQPADQPFGAMVGACRMRVCGPPSARRCPRLPALAAFAPHAAPPACPPHLFSSSSPPQVEGGQLVDADDLPNAPGPGDATELPAPGPLAQDDQSADPTYLQLQHLGLLRSLSATESGPVAVPDVTQAVAELAARQKRFTLPPAATLSALGGPSVNGARSSHAFGSSRCEPCRKPRFWTPSNARLWPRFAPSGRHRSRPGSSHVNTTRLS